VPSAQQEQEKAIIKNWENLKSQVLKLTNKTTNLEQFLDKVQDEMMTAPASTRLDLVCSYAGGLVEHSLRVFVYMAKLRKIYDLEKVIPVESVILCALLHDLGKIGDELKNYYLDQKDDWKKNKFNQNYEINEIFAAIPVSQLTLRWLSKYSFNLDNDEWYAISSVRDPHKDESVPVKNEPLLAVILQQAVKMACIKGKNKKEVSIVTAQ
jgi:hypothetical protein